MTKKVMDRKASDNAYLHKDFHAALNCAVAYVRERHGPEKLREFLRDFAVEYHAPLREKLKNEGLAALRSHLEKKFAAEGGKFELSSTDGELRLTVMSCPAILHLRKCGVEISPFFCETTRVTNEAVCEGTVYESELLEPDVSNGTCVQIFRKKRG